MCPCGSGKKFKRCCGVRRDAVVSSPGAATRMKGGVSFDPSVNAYRAIVHSWDNAECIGEPDVWQSSETFPTEDAAMEFYKAKIRPGLAQILAEAARRTDSRLVHRRLE